jgi:hypothetical protein
MAQVDIGSPGEEHRHQSSRRAGENAHIVSASPFRATIQIKDHGQSGYM